MTEIPLPSPGVCGLSDEVPYYFVVTAVEDGDEGGNSVEVSSTTDPKWVADRSGLLPKS